MIKVFDFKCTVCDKVDEYYFKEEQVPQCKHCGSTKMQRLPPATRGFVEKGPYDRYL